jgi:mannosylglycerate hydrolase
MSRRRIAIVPHTHWDREWYSPFQTFRLGLVDLLDDLLPVLDSDPGYAHFLLDGQMAVVDDYLAIRPEAEGMLRRLVGSGRVAVGPWYTLPDEFCVSGETMVRNLQLGMARATAFGGAMDIGYLPDMFGHVAQMPQLLKLCGFDQAVVWRGVPQAVDRTSFWWSSPDGSTVRAEYLWHGYGNGAAIPDDAKALVTRLATLVADVGPALAGDVLFMNGTDHQRPQPWLSRVVNEVNAISNDFELVVSSLPEALAHSAATLGDGADQLPRWQGELRSGARCNLLMGVASNRVDVKQAAARVERALERQAEPLAALWMGPARWPTALLAQAWLEMARNAAHDSSCACSVDDVCDAVLVRYAEARHIALGLADRAVGALAATQSQAGAIIVNPTARPRGGVVEVVVPGDEVLEGGQLLERRPTVLTDRLLTPEDAWSWMLWFRSQRIDDHTFVLRAEVTDGDEAVELTLYCDRELSENLLVDDVKAEVNSLMAARPGVGLHVRMLQPPSHTVLWRVEDIPGYGWARWSADVSPTDRVTVSPTSLTNGLVRVDIDAGSGTFAVNGLSGLGRLVDSGDHGDTYNYSPPDHDQFVDRPDTVDVEVLEAGPLRGRIRLTCSYRWPERIDDEARARVGERVVTVRTVVELRAGERWVRVTHAWDNQCRDHRVRAVFPLPRPATTSSAECAYATVERGLHAEGGRSERALATSFSRRFVQAGGLTVVHEGLLEYELTDPAGRSVASEAVEADALSLTLLRATGMLSRVEMTYRPLPAGPPITMEGPQLQGPATATYAVCVDPDVDPYAMADEVSVPLAVVVGSGGGRQRAEQGQALSVEGAEVAALFREGGDFRGSGAVTARLTIRVFNPTAQATTLRINGRQGWIVDLRGRALSRFAEELAMGPWQILTIRLDEA